MRRLILLFLAFSSLLPKSVADMVLYREAPEVYKEHLELHLTPLEAVIEGKDKYESSDDGGVVLLAESIIYIAEDGRSYILFHRIEYTANEAGVESNKETTRSFDKDRQNIYLLKAGTYQTDGVYREVEETATFLQSPQYEAENSLYTSEAELKIIFPNVAPGTIIESIVLTETYKHPMPGEFCRTSYFSYFWPTYRTHLVLDFPDSYASRLRYKKNSALIPEPTIDTPADGRKRYEWIAKQLPDYDYEQNCISSELILPVLRLSTVADWDSIAVWFQSLTEDRSELGEELSGLVDEWTDGLTERSEIINVLTNKASDEVRYTGLDFGLSGYQPYACSTVWKNRYGDCKDKANLLRTMLKSKGIQAYVALLDTEGFGAVEKEVPLYNQFNHAIVAVPQEQGGYMFIDPTIKYLRAGNLGSGDSSRDILVLKEDSAEWSRSPDTLFGGIHVDFILDMETSGEISGRVFFKADRADASSYFTYFNEVEPNYQKNRFQRIVDQFYPGAIVIDFEYEPVEISRDLFEAKAYILIKSGAGVAETVKFPYPASWFPSFETKEERRYPFYAVRRIETMSTRLRIPESLTLKSVPPAFDAESDAFSIKAEWDYDHENNTLESKINWYPKKFEFTPDEFLAFRQSVKAALVWMSNSALLQPQSDDLVQVETNNTKLHGFPLLSNGASQLELVDERYPEGEDDLLRKLALDKVVQWFPDDIPTVYEAKVKRALVDWEEDSNDTFAVVMRGILDQYGKQVSLENRTWGEFLYARAAHESGIDDKAIDLLLEIAGNEDVSAYRRGWSGYYAAEYIARTDYAKAMELLDVHNDYVSDARDYMEYLYTSLAIRNDKVDALKTLVDEIRNTRSSSLDIDLDNVLESVANSWTYLNPQEQQELIRWFEARFTVYPETGIPKSRDRLASLKASLTKQESRDQFTETFLELLRKHGPDWYDKDSWDSQITEEALIQLIEETNKDKEVSALCNHFAQLAGEHKGSYEKFVEYLRWVMWWMDNKSCDLDLLHELAPETLSLDIDSEFELYRIWLLVGRHYFDLGNYGESNRYYQAVLDRSDAKGYQRADALTGIAKNAIETGDDASAWEAFRTMIPIYDDHTDGNDFLLLYMFFALERGEYDEALELLKLVPKMKDKWIKQSDYSVVTYNVMRSVDHPEELRQYWSHSEQWWKQWESLCEDYGIEPGDLTYMWRMDDFERLSSKVRSAAKRDDMTDFLKALRPYVLLARWLPVFLIDTNDFLEDMPDYQDRLRNRLREMLLYALNGVPETVDPEKWNNLCRTQLQNLVELGHNGEVPEKAKELIEREGREKSNAQSALRIWINATCASRTGYKEPMEMMEHWLTEGVEFSSRVWSVKVLSNLYDELNLYGRQIKLAERELQHPKISADRELSELLRTRLRIAKESDAVTARFSDSVRNWIKENNLNWFDFAEPLELDPSNPIYQKGPIEERDRWDDSVVKGNILFALDETKPIEERRMSFAFAVTVYFSRIERADAMEKAIWSALEIPELAQENRNLIVICGVEGFLEALKYKQAEKLLDSSYTTDFLPQWISSHQAVAKSIALFLRLPDQDLGRAIYPILESPATKSTDIFVETLLTRMVYLGQIEQAERVYRDTWKMKTLEVGEKNIASYRLGWLRTVKLGKLNHAFDTDLRDLISSTYDQSPKKPDILNEVLNLSSMNSYTDREQMDVTRYCLAKGFFFRSSLLEIAHDYFYKYRMFGSTEDIGIQYLKLVEKHLGNDQIDTRRLEVGVDPDGDIPAVLQEYMEITDRLLSNPLLGSETRDVILEQRAWFAIRIQEDLDYNDLFNEQVTRTLDEFTLNELKIRYLYTREEWDMLNELLESIDYTAITTYSLRTMVYDVLRKYGRDDEAELMLDMIQAEMDSDLREVWSGSYPSYLFWVLDSVAFLDTPRLLPEGLFQICAERPYDNLKQLRNEIMIAFIQHQWERVVATADEYLDHRPTIFYYYGIRGYAHAKLGHTKQAKADLEIFLKHERDDRFYPKFKELYESL